MKDLQRNTNILLSDITKIFAFKAVLSFINRKVYSQRNYKMQSADKTKQNKKRQFPCVLPWIWWSLVAKSRKLTVTETDRWYPKDLKISKDKVPPIWTISSLSDLVVFPTQTHITNNLLRIKWKCSFSKTKQIKTLSENSMTLNSMKWGSTEE